MEGGVGAFTEKIAGEFSKNGSEVHIITSRDARPQGERRSVWDIHEPYDLGYAQLHARIKRWWWPAMSIPAQIAARYDLEIINVQYQAAAFDMNIPAVSFLPWRLRGLCKTVVTFHDLRVPYLFPKAGGLRNKALHQLARSADGVIVTNGEDYNQLLAIGIGADQLVQLPIGSNIPAYDPDPAVVSRLRKDLLSSENGVLLGYFGFLNSSKGADILVHTLSGLPPEFELIFIGGQTGASDSAKNRRFLDNLQQQIKDRGIRNRIHWSGFLEDSEVSAYLHACDLVVMPYRDGVSLRRGTLMAALAHGCTIITTEPTAPVEPLVHGENVWMTPADSPASLGTAVVHLAGDRELRLKLSRGAKLISERFSWPEIAARTESFFSRVIENGR